MDMICPTTILADAGLPDALTQKIGAQSQNATHFSPAFVGLAIIALAVVGYLLWDVFRQKREERRQRQRIERFREQKFKQVQQPPTR